MLVPAACAIWVIPLARAMSPSADLQARVVLMPSAAHPNGNAAGAEHHGLPRLNECLAVEDQKVRGGHPEAEQMTVSETVPRGLAGDSWAHGQIGHHGGGRPFGHGSWEIKCNLLTLLRRFVLKLGKFLCKINAPSRTLTPLV
jgi:hypothetical protein